MKIPKWSSPETRFKANLNIFSPVSRPLLKMSLKALRVITLGITSEGLGGASEHGLWKASFLSLRLFPPHLLWGKQESSLHHVLYSVTHNHKDIFIALEKI